MKLNVTKPVQKPALLRRAWPVALILSGTLAGCAAMEGVTVGANVPLGGIVNVGASKTVGDGTSSQPPAGRQAPPRTPEENSDESEQEETQ